MKTKYRHLISSLFLTVSSVNAAQIQFEGSSSDFEKASFSRISGYEPEASVPPDEVTRIVERLRRTGLFHEVLLEQRDSNQFVVTPKKKWTTIPIFKLRNSGVNNLFTIGVYDPDFLKSMNELGLQYEQFNKSPSFVTWTRLNGFVSWRNRLGLEYWDTKRDLQQRFQFQQLEQSFGLAQKKFVLFLEHTLSEKPFKKIVLNNEILSNSYVRRPFSQEATQRPTLLIPEDIRWNKLGSTFTIGEIDSYLPGLEIGSESSFGPYWISSLNHKSQHCAGIDFKNRNFWHLNSNLLLGGNVKIGHISNCDPSFHYTLGGLFDVRGLPESAIVARSFFLSNLELRYILTKNSWLVTQGVLGGDAAFFKSIHDLKSNALSATLGGRAIFPKVYRLNVRLDYSREYSLKTGVFSFGIQQFF